MMKLTKISYKLLVIGCWLLAIVGSSCTDIPENPTCLNQQPSIYPDYIGVTIPADIAPLNFSSADENIATW